MAKVPFSPEPSVAPSTSSLGRQESSASPAAFGSGLATGLADIGQSEEQSGTSLAQHAVVFQQINNKTEGDEQFTNYIKGSNDLLYGDGKTPGYYDLKGQAAIDAFPYMQAKLVQLRGDIANKSSNPVVRQEFEANSRRLESYSMGDMSRHAAQERNVWIANTNDGKAAAGAQMAVLGYNDPAKVAAGLDIQHDAIAQQAVLQGKPPEWIAQQYAEAQSKTYAGVIEREAVDNPYGAMASYKANQDKMLAPEIVSVGNHLHSILQPIQADDLANKIMSNFSFTDNDPRAHLDDVLKQVKDSGADPRVQKMAESTIRGQIGMIASAQVAQHRDAYNNTASAILGDPNNRSSAPSSWAQYVARNPNWQDDWSKLRPSEQDHFVDMLAANGSGKRIVPTDASEKLYATLRGEALSDPQKFLSQNVSEAGGGVLPYSDRRSLMNLQAQIANKAPPNQDITHAMSVVNTTLGVNKIVTDQDEHNQFTGRMMDNIETFEKVHGRKPNDADIVKMGQQLLLTTSHSFFGGDTKAYQVPAIPEADRSLILDAYKTKGLPVPDEQQIMSTYQAKHGKR